MTNKLKELQREHDAKLQRSEAAKAWGPRLDAIETALGLTRNRFCRRYKKINTSTLSRCIRQKQIPSDELVKYVEKSIRTEERKIEKKSKK